MTRRKKHLRNFIKFITIVGKMVISSLDVSNDKQTIIEKQPMNPEDKTNKIHTNQQLQKRLRTFSGTSKIYLINELWVSTSLHINRTIETNPKFHTENTLHTTKTAVNIQIGCTILTINLPLRTAFTMNNLPVITKIVQEQLLLIETLQIFNLRLHTKETNLQP